MTLHLVHDSHSLSKWASWEVYFHAKMNCKPKPGQKWINYYVWTFSIHHIPKAWSSIHAVADFKISQSGGFHYILQHNTFKLTLTHSSILLELQTVDSIIMVSIGVAEKYLAIKLIAKSWISDIFSHFISYERVGKKQFAKHNANYSRTPLISTLKGPSKMS